MDEPNQARDYCILTLFLNCGLRISELVSLNITDVREVQLRVLGKGNKERMIFLNEACRAALDDWLEERSRQAAADPNALFLTRTHTRMTKDAVHYMVKQRLKKPGWMPLSIPAISCGTPRPLSCCRMVWMCARFRRCWDTKT